MPDTDRHPPPAKDRTRDTSNTDEVSNQWATVPNALSLFRWIGSLGLLGLALYELPRAFVVWYLVLGLSDWLDGKIAVHFHQRSVLGPRLDSFADVTLNACLGIGLFWLWYDTILAELPWIATALSVNVAATSFALWKFGRWPSYHTRMAKASWGFIILAVIGIAWNISTWPLRVAMIVGVVANLESILITLRASRWHEDVIGIWALPAIEAAATDKVDASE